MFSLACTLFFWYRVESKIKKKVSSYEAYKIGTVITLPFLSCFFVVWFREARYISDYGCLSMAGQKKRSAPDDDNGADVMPLSSSKVEEGVEEDMISMALRMAEEMSGPITDLEAAVEAVPVNTGRHKVVCGKLYRFESVFCPPHHPFPTATLRIYLAGCRLCVKASLPADWYSLIV